MRKKNLWRYESAMGSIEILGSLYMKPGMKINLYETDKVILPWGEIYLNVYMLRNDMKFTSG